ncbi:MAG: UDP-N-acetylmuramoyl-L-alanyl-D-glutamate--2,6-diaminopimelate ligase [Deltaproteobacteria bacterium]|nr:UDP-N-acetylmuramoyl-L-alanyl-D-glutamate--2,6-diaminopimelate ligase [Deltaproteobacteria bacterium]
MKLSELIRNIPIVKIHSALKNLEGIDIENVTSDSRKVTPQTLFVAVRGLVSDGHQYSAAAISQGAKAIVVEKKQSLDSKIVQIEVADSREALAHLASAVYRHPTKELVLVGVTGTNGKTTSTYLLEAVFKEARFKPGVIGTVNYRYLGKKFAASHTTPESTEFQALLREMKTKGVSHVAMEVSSHALKLRRVDGSHFDVALFTNLTQDHLDFHGDFKDYFESKKRLFTELIPKSEKKQKASVINLDDPYGQKLYQELKKINQQVSGFSLKNSKAEISVKKFQFDLNGLKADLQTPKGMMAIESLLLGEHNLSNILGIVGCSLALHIPIETIQKGIWNLKNVPGRLERVEAGQPFLVLVDYAHTDDALKNVGRALQKLKKQRILTVFGCGGDRDRKKRPLMAQAAKAFSDFVIVTSDNPRTEEPNSIIEEILVGFEGKKEGVFVEVDRKKAIHKAISMAKSQDIILIAGKGHEDYQIIGKTKIHFDDREIATEALCLRQKKS